MTDFGFFGIAMAFFSPSTIIPSFLTELGASNTVIGLMSTLQRACWLLPQLFAARLIADKPYKKPYILWPAAIGRSLLLFLAGIVWATGGQPPGLLIPLVAVIFAAFWIGDGLASLSWFDLLSKAIPPTRRGRLTGVGQTLSGILSFMGGFVVEWILSDRGLPYPINYAVLFVIAFVLLMISFLGIALVVERKSTTTRAIPTWREYLPQLWGILKNDHTFRNYILVRQFVNLSMLATPFYMTYALDTLGLPDHVAGRYTSIGVVGGKFSIGGLYQKLGLSPQAIYLSPNANIYSLTDTFTTAQRELIRKYMEQSYSLFKERVLAGRKDLTPDSLESLAQGKADVAAAQLTVTEEREKLVAFTRPTATVAEFLRESAL